MAKNVDDAMQCGNCGAAEGSDHTPACEREHGELRRWERSALSVPAHGGEAVQIAGWIHEDELPSGYPYDEMFPFSKVDIVRMFPVYAPATVPAGGAREAVAWQWKFPSTKWAECSEAEYRACKLDDNDYDPRIQWRGLYERTSNVTDEAVEELIDAADYALRTRDDAGALSDTAEYNLSEALKACRALAAAPLPTTEGGNRQGLLDGSEPPRPAASDWRIDTSAGRPILVYQDCSVIESEQARYLLRLIEADSQAVGVEEIDKRWRELLGTEGETANLVFLSSNLRDEGRADRAEMVDAANRFIDQQEALLRILMRERPPATGLAGGDGEAMVILERVAAEEKMEWIGDHRHAAVHAIQEVVRRFRAALAARERRQGDEGASHG